MTTTLLTTHGADKPLQRDIDTRWTMHKLRGALMLLQSLDGDISTLPEEAQKLFLEALQRIQEVVDVCAFDCTAD